MTDVVGFKRPCPVTLLSESVYGGVQWWWVISVSVCEPVVSESLQLTHWVVILGNFIP